MEEKTQINDIDRSIYDIKRRLQDPGRSDSGDRRENFQGKT